MKQINIFGEVDEVADEQPLKTTTTEQPLQIIVSFETYEDVKEFEKLIGQKLTYKTKQIQWPKLQQTISSEI